MKSNSHGESPKFYTIQEAAWVLGIAESDLCRLVRLGVVPVVRRRSRLVISATALARLLPTPDEGAMRR